MIPPRCGSPASKISTEKSSVFLNSLSWPTLPKATSPTFTRPWCACRFRWLDECVIEALSSRQRALVRCTRDSWRSWVSSMRAVKLKVCIRLCGAWMEALTYPFLDGKFGAMMSVGLTNEVKKPRNALSFLLMVFRRVL